MKKPLFRLRLLCLFLITGFANPTIAQQAAGGKAVFNFLNLQPSARASALGGWATGHRDVDLGLAWQNPALLDSLFNNQLSLSFSNHFSDIKHGLVQYAKFLNPRWGTVSAGLQFVQYGTFTQTNEQNEVLGTFSANELNLQAGWGKTLNAHWTVGANLKLIYSGFQAFHSTGLAADLAVTWRDSAQQINVTGIIRNAGRQLTAYQNELEPLPLDIQLAVSKKLKHLPFRYGIVLHSLNRWNTAYYDPTDRVFRGQVQLLGSNEPEPVAAPNLAEEVLNHVVLNGEILLGKALTMRLGYNHQRRQELTIPNRAALSGFSWGFGIKTKKFRLDYGHALFTLAGSTNTFSLGIPLDAY